MKTILYLTDLYYEAKGRNYYEEDLYITSKLKNHFNLLIGHPQQVLSYPAVADLVVFRNTGPVIGYQDYFNRFVKMVNEKQILTFNSFDGKADMKGKQYLPDLFSQGYPVIPTIEKLEDLHQLGDEDTFVVKLKNGADSIGMEIFGKEDLLNEQPTGKLIQPLLDFAYEVSFYYLDDVFQYALYAPDKTKRWALKEYQATPDDLHFADTFLKWNNMARGIVRVDACRLKNGTLQLVELEDMNPFLSLDLLPLPKREQFIANLVASLQKAG
ncbi:MAG TPA: hypothetical protein VFT06_02630 [Flavisolibacter sp.]|nr:hypothetical protein [Flavisolibacter sp.]